MNYMQKSAIIVYWFVCKPRLYNAFYVLLDSGYHIIDAFNIIYQNLT